MDVIFLVWHCKWPVDAPGYDRIWNELCHKCATTDCVTKHGRDEMICTAASLFRRQIPLWKLPSFLSCTRMQIEEKKQLGNWENPACVGTIRGKQNESLSQFLPFRAVRLWLPIVMSLSLSNKNMKEMTVLLSQPPCRRRGHLLSFFPSDPDLLFCLSFNTDVTIWLPPHFFSGLISHRGVPSVKVKLQI